MAATEQERTARAAQKGAGPMSASLWVITLSFDVDLDMDRMDALETALDDVDGFVARVPSHGVDVTVHAPGDMSVHDALLKAADRVVSMLGVGPVGVETITEEEQARRAETSTMPALMSAAEVADELGISRQRVHQLRSTAAFPLPLADLRGGAVWDAAAVRKFAQTWERKPGRPRSVGAAR
jgi:hypothetical protein